MARPHELASGTYTGTGSAQTITLGFQPQAVLAYNQTDGTAAWFFINGMTAATAANLSSSGTANVGSQGCTLISTGFSLGTSSVVNGNTKVYYYVAFGC